MTKYKISSYSGVNFFEIWLQGDQHPHVYNHYCYSIHDRYRMEKEGGRLSCQGDMKDIEGIKSIFANKLAFDSKDFLKVEEILTTFSFFNAVKDSRLDELKEIQKCVDVNTIFKNAYNKKGITPLILAVQNGNLEIIQFLIEAGADVDTMVNGSNALIQAVQLINPAIVELLIKHNANLDLKDNKGNTALAYVISNNFNELMPDEVDNNNIKIFNLINSAKAADVILENPSEKVSITFEDIFEERYKYFLNKNGFNCDYPSYINKLKENETIPESIKNKLVDLLNLEANEESVASSEINMLTEQTEKELKIKVEAPIPATFENLEVENAPTIFENQEIGCAGDVHDGTY